MYLSYYGLKAEPFLLAPDHRFYYDSAVHSQAMAHLVYGVNRGEGFIIITGEIGAGKTTLVKHLCACIDVRRIVAAHVVTTMVEGVDLLRVVMAAFGITDIPSEKGAMLLRLQYFFEQAHRKGRRALLVIDEAQNLSVSALEELRLISNFQIGSVVPFQTFLVGQPEFRNILASADLEQLRQRIITSYHLGPMSREEVGKYLPHRLTKAGWRNDPTFDEAFVDRMFHFTQGIPRRINALASRMLLYGFLEKLHRFSADDVDKVAADLLTEAPVARAPGEARKAGSTVEEGDFSDRIERLERQLKNQDENMSSTIAVLRDFLKLAVSEREKNSLSSP
jgi:general secretion pathway protein A